jgi:hypothetical protein
MPKMPEMSMEEEFHIRGLFSRADALQAAILELGLDEHDQQLRDWWQEYVIPVLEVEHAKAHKEFRAEAARLGFQW